MRTGRNVIVTLFIVAVLLAVAVVFMNMNDGANLYTAKLYFMNESFTSMSEETRDIKYDNPAELPDSVLEELKKGPTDSKNKPFISKNTEWTVTNESASLLVDFNQEFLTEDNSKNLLATYAVVKSLCSLDDVAEVKVTVDGGELVTPDNSTIGYLTDKDINLETDTVTSENRNIKLYFATEDGSFSEEWRNIKITDTVPVEQYVVTELIKGPEAAELKPVLSADTKLISVEVTDGTAYINMTQGFVNKHKGSPEKEATAVYSIVKSVTAVDGVNSVQFLIEGKKTSGFDSIDLTAPLGTDIEIVYN